MRTLSTKLVLAFALTSLLAIGLAALLIRQLVVAEFDAYVLDQRRSAFVEDVSAYYSANGSWAGISPAIFQGGGGEQGHAPNAPPGEGPWSRFDFVLADADGNVVLSPNPLERGKQADEALLAKGTAVTVNGERVGTVCTYGPPRLRNPAEERYLARTDIALGAAALGAVGVALILGLFLARLITRPVRDLTSAARAIAAGDLRQQVQVRSRDELGVLAEQFNQMSAGLARSNELRRRMTADIAHDLRTPLTVISGYLEAMRDETLPPSTERFTTMHDETQVLLRLVQDLHTLSLADAGELPLKRQPVTPQRLLERVATSYEHSAAQLGISLSAHAAPALPELRVDVEQTVRVLSNLVSNALRHTPAGGSVTLSAQQDPRGVAISVADTGQGIPAEHLPNIFERFYRADASRQQATGGSGLGLAIVRSIVEAHGGQVAVSSAAGRGSVFSIVLPVEGSAKPGKPDQTMRGDPPAALANRQP
jgi:signal transduction histidine kinase